MNAAHDEPEELESPSKSGGGCHSTSERTGGVSVCFARKTRRGVGRGRVCV